MRKNGDMQIYTKKGVENESQRPNVFGYYFLREAQNLAMRSTAFLIVSSLHA